MHKFKIKKGFFLVFTLLLTVLVTSACLVMVQAATMNKNSSSSEVYRENLKNLANQFVRAIAKTLDSTTAASFMSTLNSQKANLFLADVSGGLPPVVVCNVIPPTTTAAFGCNPNPPGIANSKSILSLSDKFKITPPAGGAKAATVSLSSTDAPTANVNSLEIDPNLNPTIIFTQTSYSSSGATATYGLTIDVQICGTISNTSICQKANVPTNYTFTRTCPNSSLNSPTGKTMRALTDAEIKSLSGGQYTNSTTFPNLYCTCSEAGFGQTKSDGTCAVSCSSGQYVSGNSCLPCSTTAGCATCITSATNCTSCKPNYIYDSSSNTCTCPSGFYKDSNGNCNACNSSCATCSGNANNCTSCSGTSMGLSSGTCSSCAIPGKYFVNSSSACGTCNSSCATCSGSGSNQCLSCNGSMGLSGGTCSSCTGSTYFVNNTSACGNCDSSCAACSGVGSNQCLTCRSGSPVNGTCPSCTGGSVAGGGGVRTGISNCACPDNTYYWNGSSCILCPSYSVGVGGYGPMTPIGSCRCNDSTAVWSNKFRICIFPCYYEPPYVCHQTTAPPDGGYFCANCGAGSTCTSNYWGFPMTIDKSYCVYCPDNTSGPC